MGSGLSSPYCCKGMHVDRKDMGRRCGKPVQKKICERAESRQRFDKWPKGNDGRSKCVKRRQRALGCSGDDRQMRWDGRQTTGRALEMEGQNGPGAMPASRQERSRSRVPGVRVRQKSKAVLEVGSWGRVGSWKLSNAGQRKNADDCGMGSRFEVPQPGRCYVQWRRERFRQLAVVMMKCEGGGGRPSGGNGSR